MKPLTLSIIIPARNEERHLRACLDAIAVQTVMPDEVIVVDNNSTDATAEIARRYGFVRVIREPRQGIVFARNAGFDATTAQIIGRIDADTVLPADWVERVKGFYENLAHANTALTGAAYVYNARLPHFLGWVQAQFAFRMNRFLVGHYILWGSNMAIPSELWRKVRPHICLRNDIHEDLDLAIHAHEVGAKIGYSAGLKVGIKVRRVAENRADLWPNLMLWPQTLRVHGKVGWIGGVAGAVLLYILSPVPLFFEWFSRLIGKPPLKY